MFSNLVPSEHTTNDLIPKSIPMVLSAFILCSIFLTTPMEAKY